MEGPTGPLLVFGRPGRDAVRVRVHRDQCVRLPPLAHPAHLRGDGLRRRPGMPDPHSVGALHRERLTGSLADDPSTSPDNGPPRGGCGWERIAVEAR